MSDRSARRVLIWSGVAGAIALGAALVLAAMGLAQVTGAIAVVLFGLMIAYHGVRQGRTTYLVDAAGRIARVWRKVKVKGHAAEVLEAAKAL